MDDDVACRYAEEEMYMEARETEKEEIKRKSC
jgi:hypothetical protein